jgi:hypothetical protein
MLVMAPLAKLRESTILTLSRSAPARMAYLLPSRILMATFSRGISFPMVLGKAMAHELGHVLLPGQGHTATGAMCASALCSDRVEGFSASQGASIRALLKAATEWSDEDTARELWSRSGGPNK